MLSRVLLHVVQSPVSVNGSAYNSFIVCQIEGTIQYVHDVASFVSEHIHNSGVVQQSRVVRLSTRCRVEGRGI
jgi:hypothetical protein